MAALSAMVLALAGCAPAHPPADARAFVVTVGMNGSTCFIMADGQAVTMDELFAIARTEAGKGRSARVEVDHETTPYRCVGGVFYTLQMAGLKNVGFVAEPPP